MYIWYCLRRYRMGTVGFMCWVCWDWGLDVLWCGHADVVILGCYLFVYTLNEACVMCIYNGHICPYLGPFVSCGYSDICTLGYSLSMYRVG